MRYVVGFSWIGMPAVAINENPTTSEACLQCKHIFGAIVCGTYITAINSYVNVIINCAQQHESRLLSIVGAIRAGCCRPGRGHKSES